MAARLNPRHSEMVRAKIRTSQLINRLQDEALGKIALLDGERESAKFLINKSLANPPEQKILSGDPNAPLKHAVEFHIVDHRASDKD